MLKLMNPENKLQTVMENCSLSDSSKTDPLPNAFNTHKGELLKPDDTIEQCVKFIERCQKENELPHRLRGPYLASFLLFNRLSEERLDPSKYLGTWVKFKWRYSRRVVAMTVILWLCVVVSGTPLDMFKSYFELFAEKACCFKDLHQFLPLMQNDYISLLSATWALIKQTDEGEVKNVRFDEYRAVHSYRLFPET